MDYLGIYAQKKVLVTGHTGFKGAWLSIWLKELGAEVIGFSLAQWPNEHLFNKTGLSGKLIDQRGDIADIQRLEEAFVRYKPEIIFHLAAQSLVRDSYSDPVKTFNNNFMGTVNVLECIRKTDSVKAGVIVTTDKCYKDKEWRKGYRETDELGGYDPYCASKAAAELAVDSYRNSFLKKTGKLAASARAGNSIGGGDFSKDRLIPDCILALKENKPIKVRNPGSIRPWQHVLEPLYGYLLLGSKLLSNEKAFAAAWNFGPEKESIIPVAKVVELVIKNWGSGKQLDARNPDDLHEAGLLNLDISKVKRKLKWKPKWDIEEAVNKTVYWYKNADDNNAYKLCVKQIGEYLDER
jgi:CDP-glucose 4,6-dehydratase